MKHKTTTPALIPILFAATLLLGINALIAIAQAPADVAVTLNPSVLSIIYTPADFSMGTVRIDSPITSYYSYYNNPRNLDPDQNPATRDGTALQVQDGRFKGGFELQAQVDTDYKSVESGENVIPRENLGIRTDIGGTGENNGTSEINETVTADTPAVTAPLDSAGDYTAFTSPLVLLNGATQSCDEGRVGIYTVYPSFRLHIPNETRAGTYTTSITYTLMESPTCQNATPPGTQETQDTQEPPA